MVNVKTSYTDEVDEDEVTITLNWKGRLRVFFTGKLTLKKTIIQYMLTKFMEAREDYE